MPIFEFRCQDCGCEFEKLVRADEKAECPECGCSSPKRLFSVFGVKSGGKFTPSSGASCGSCTASSCESCMGQ